MSIFRRWIGRTEPEPEREDAPDAVAEVVMIFHDGRREMRGFFKVGEAFYFSHTPNPDTAKRVLPHGKIGNEGPTYIIGWEPVTPPDWQPDGAQTSHERIASLEREIAAVRAEMIAKVSQAKEHAKQERARWRMIAAAVQEAEAYDRG